MKRNFGILQEELGNALQAAMQEPNAISRYLSCVQVAESAISRMKETILTDPFQSKEEEIHHFKHEATEVYSQLFYYLKLVQIEGDRPYAEEDRFQASLRQRTEELAEFFELHDHICRYYNRGFSHQDEYLFLRRPAGQWSGDEIGTYIPPDFTIGTYWIAWIKANHRLRNWIQEQQAAPIQRRVIRWTGNRIDLIVVFCALQLAGCFDKNTLKEVMEWVEEQFGIKVGQFHVALNQLATQKDPVQFLKRLIGVLSRKFDSMLE